jgi:DNA replication protein DnaC
MEAAELEKVIYAKRVEHGIKSPFVPGIVPDRSEMILKIPTSELPVSTELQSDPRKKAWESLVRLRGKRYADCRLSNFELRHEQQRSTVERLENFAKGIHSHVTSGHGVLCFGAKGTGKDHLLMALARVAVGHHFSVHWMNGAEMRGDVRDSTKMDDLERNYVATLVRPDVLWISDPLPVSGSLTEAQQDRLFRVLDARYSRLKPTWVTVNVANREELEERMGPQNADRLRDGALAVFCDWPSFREVMK